jgi:hypothetical protein
VHGIGNICPMNDKTANTAGIPEPDPPKGGPEADPDVPDPADLTPGLGGTSDTKPSSADDSDD